MHPYFDLCKTLAIDLLTHILVTHKKNFNLNKSGTIIYDFLTKTLQHVAKHIQNTPFDFSSGGDRGTHLSTGIPGR